MKQKGIRVCCWSILTVIIIFFVSMLWYQYANVQQLLQKQEVVQQEIEYIFDSLETYMIDDAGGICSNLQSAPDTIYSESQGLMMEIAFAQDDKELFDSSYGAIKQYQHESGLFPWRVVAGESAGSNATLDDLRIFVALYQANELWGGYYDELVLLEQGLLECCVYEGRLSNFYDFAMEEASSELSLAYIDATMLAELCEFQEEWKSVEEASVNILVNGVISELFPLYYKSYNGIFYSQDDLHMTETLCTMYHASRSGLLPAEGLQWLQDEIDAGGIYARYDLSGNVTEEGRFESPAIYALAVLVFLEEGDRASAENAISLMRTFQIQEGEYTFLYGDKDTADIYAFDQLLVLQALQKYEQAIQEDVRNSSIEARIINLVQRNE